MPVPSLDSALLARGTVLFQDGAGNLHVTVIVKATYRLRHGALAEPAPALPLGDDVYHDEIGSSGRPRSLYAASDLAPCKRLADVVVVGRAHPRSPGVVRQVVGFAVARGPDILLRKRLVAIGDRKYADAPPAPLAPLPLTWERTWGGRDNPAGCGLSDGDSRLPSFIDLDAPRRAAGLGPIAPTWPARLAFLSKEHTDALAADPLVLSDDFDLRFFQCAPADQQLPRILGGEQILLIGFNPDHPVMHCRLPAQHAYARLDGPGAPGRDVPLVGDTLWIDAERGLACVTFRGSMQVATRARAPGMPSHRQAQAWTVRAGMAPCANVEEVVGSPRAWSLSMRSTGASADEALEERPPSASPTVDRPAVVNESGFAVGGFDWSFEPAKLRRVVVVKGTFDLSPDGGKPALSAEQDRLRADEPASDDAHAELVHASDLVPFKAQTDVLLRGTAHATSGRATVLVQMELGPVLARLVALGPRSWDSNGIPSSPGSFVPVPLRYEHAFGGPGFSANPAGTGFVAGTPPPRLEDPERLIRSRADRPSPVCFAPMAPVWPARRALLGSYDSSWQEERWPYFPADFDPSFFQAAPPRLRCEHLRGDEPFRIEGVRADGKSFSGTLPGTRPRVFAVRRSGDPFEVVLRLDTVLFDTDTARVFSTWRGSFEIERTVDDIDRLVVLREDLDSPQGVNEIAARLTALTEPLLAPDTTLREARAGSAEARSFRFGDHRRALAGGAVLAGAFVARAARAAPSPPAPPAPPSKQAIEKLVGEGKSLRGRDLSGADLRGIDLSRQDLSNAILARAKLAGARFAAANLAGANLTDIDAPDTLWDGADLSRADFTRANLVQASLVGAKLEKASLAGAMLSDACLDDIEAGGADLSGADLSRCRAEGAHLEKADLSGAMLVSASLRCAHLDDAKLYETQGAGAQLDEASLADARFEKASFPESSFRGVVAPGAVWECADLSRAVFRGADVTGAIFAGARLIGADFGGISGRTAMFRAADLSRATLDGADLMQASFEGARLDGASLKGVSLYQAELHRASLEGADLSKALVAGTKLEK